MSVKHLSDGRSDGTTLGQDDTDKISFHGVTPVARQTVGAAVATTAATSSTPFGYSQAQANAIVERLNEIRAALVTAGLLK